MTSGALCSNANLFLRFLVENYLFLLHSRNAKPAASSGAFVIARGSFRPPRLRAFGGSSTRCTDSGAACGHTMKKVLFAPFRTGTAHIMFFWVIFPGRPVPRWAQKRHQSTDDAAEKGNQNGYGKRRPSHVTLQAKKQTGIWGRCMAQINPRARWSDRAYAPPSYCWARRSECREARARAPCGAPLNRR
jgi:hypothetical protein